MTHISDHSCSNHKIQVVIRLIQYDNDILSCLPNDDTLSARKRTLAVCQSMLRESSDLVINRPGHESLWYHRRALVELIFCTLSQWQGIFTSESSMITKTLILKIKSFETDLVAVLDSISDINSTTPPEEMSLSFLNKLFHSVSHLLELGKDSPDASDAIVLFVYDWLSYEISFIFSAILKNHIWDDNKNQQSHLVLQYFHFSLSRVC